VSGGVRPERDGKLSTSMLPDTTPQGIKEDYPVRKSTRRKGFTNTPEPKLRAKLKLEFDCDIERVVEWEKNSEKKDKEDYRNEGVGNNRKRKTARNLEDNLKLT
jgi:hypothetical protein